MDQPMHQPNSGVHAISTDHQLDSLISSGVRIVLNCWAPWAAPCEQMNAVLQTLEAQHRKRYASMAVDEHSPVLFASMQPEKLPAIMKRYNISTVPTFLLFANRRLVRRSSGADAVLLSNNVRWLTDSSHATLLNAACDVVSTRGEVTLVMKGTPDEPRCGFSRQAVQLLRTAGVQFSTFNVLDDEQVRSVMKERFNWPTFPMLFARGKLIGGIDIMRELADEGQLLHELCSEAPDEHTEDVTLMKPAHAEKRAENGALRADKAAGADAGAERGADARADAAQGEEADALSVELRERLAGLVSGSEVMLFMKGSPTSPRCGFSRRITQILREQGVQFGYFDILTDDEVRQGLKKFSQWPTFPQLYSKGKLIGGLDIVKELVEGGELKKELTA